MSRRAVALSATKSGVTRLLEKGGASPESLWILRNGYINAAKRATQRPGTEVDATLPAGTKGLCYFDGKFHVFASSVITMTDPDYVCDVLVHPTNAALTLHEIHFAEPFLRGLYVAAEYSNGDVYHFWLAPAEAWEAGKAYAPGDLVHPTTENGLVYRAYRLAAPGTVWAANTEYAVGDVIEPTTFAGYTYTAIEAHGAPPRSGATEPTWATTGTTTEEADRGTFSTSTDTPATDTAAPSTVTERYGSGVDAKTGGIEP